MKILVTGKNGLVGYELERSLASLGEVVAVGREDCDLTDAAAIVSLVEKVKPSLIVNSPIYMVGDEMGVEPEIACAINAIAPKLLAAQANLLHIPIVHYSSAYVFDGTKDGPYLEDDLANPQSVYGKTQWQGEKNVRAMCSQHVILRTSWIFGTRGDNGLKKLLKLAQEKDELKFVADQFGAPTSARFLADSTAKIVEKLLGADAVQKSGTYHLATSGATTWYGYAQKVIGFANRLGIETRVRDNDICPILTEAVNFHAGLSKNCCLKVQKIERVFDLTIPDWAEDVESSLEEAVRVDS